ncbi:vacuolar ATPase assembly integral membrane protein vma21 [Oncorhynchus masou masou]|uniref:vacuolar ATPase assembly integral membrane protein vma21 n=1 Tax=Oncorhynchus masou masou TaxID=90313 RepID=UPI0031845B9E
MLPGSPLCFHRHTARAIDIVIFSRKYCLCHSVKPKMDNYNKQSLNSMPGPVPDFRGNDGSLVSVLKTLLFFTVMMITLPIGLYFTSKSYIFEASGYSSNDSYFYAAIVAVVAVHVVLALFVYVAWNEGTGSHQTREGKQD